MHVAGTRTSDLSNQAAINNALKLHKEMKTMRSGRETEKKEKEEIRYSNGLVLRGISGKLNE